MSGGSWDYLTYKMEDAADRLEIEKDPLRRAFGKKMRLFAKAMHDIEWVDSGDSGEESETDSIQKAIGENYQALVLEELVVEAKALQKEFLAYEAWCEKTHQQAYRPNNSRVKEE